MNLFLGLLRPASISLLLLVRVDILAAVAQVPSQRQAMSLVFKEVTVVDVVDGSLHPGQAVIVEGNRVRAVGSVGKVHMPSGVHVVDGRGKYLIPGLWDMHVHVGSMKKSGQAFIANGVTGIRDMGQEFPDDVDSFRVWQRQIDAGAVIAPRIIGPSVDLMRGLFEPLPFKTSKEARVYLEALKRAGVVFLKFHNDLEDDRDRFFLLLREARRAGLDVVGHVPIRVSSIEAVDSGMGNIEHANENRPCWPWGPKLMPSLVWDDRAIEGRCAPMVTAYIRNGTWMTPTLVVTDYFPEWESIVRAMRRLGFRRFLAGSDGHGDGFSLRQELALLVEAGLTPLEALQAATLNPAKYMKATDSLGSVAPGKLADLVLLDADPLADIHNVMKIHAVVANGRYFDRTALDTLDPHGVESTRKYLAYLAKMGRHPRVGHLGLRGSDMNAISDTLRGVMVLDIVGPNSAAQNAGISVGEVIVAADHEPVESSRELMRVVRLHNAGETVRLKVIGRKGRSRIVDVTLN